jgi:hypothetical protein
VGLPEHEEIVEAELKALRLDNCKAGACERVNNRLRLGAMVLIHLHPVDDSQPNEDA